MTRYDAVVVGSGTIGLSAAWRLSATGRSVALFDPSPAGGASRVAAGMLAPVTEVTWTETALVELNVRAAAAWPAFAAELEAAGGSSVGFRRCGTLLVAYDASDRAALEELCEFHRSLGLSSTWCGPQRCRELEERLSPGVRGGIDAAGDHQVDNRRLLAALQAATQSAGVTAVRQAVRAVEQRAGTVEGVVVGEELIQAPLVVVAAGHASGAIEGIPDEVRAPVRPVKGQLLRMRTADGQRFCDRNVRALVAGSPVYLVSRDDGGVVIGATQEERGTDTSVTAEGLYTLLRDATRVCPSVADLELVEASAGLRPATPDNEPFVGPTSLGGLVYATGHFRHGVLLTPVTAQAIVELVEHGALPEWMAPFAPSAALGAR